MTILALSGKARSGKDSFANVLVKKHGFTRIALADSLKNLCARVFYMDPSEFEDEKKDQRIQRVHLDFHDIDAIRTIVQNEWNFEITEEDREYLEEYHGTGYDTPRDILRGVGMMLRDHVDQDIWIKLVLEKIKEVGAKVVITDCRFPNERDIFKNMGGTLIKIKRNDNGETSEHEFNLGPDSEYDVVFDNSSTLEKYQSEIDMWYTIKKDELKYYRQYNYDYTLIREAGNE